MIIFYQSTNHALATYHIEYTLFPSFIPIPGKYFNMENSALFLVVYQRIWATTCVAGMSTGEGTVTFHG